jgi:phosphoglycerol transferase MdoB-like AlkP superfamily enzyme
MLKQKDASSVVSHFFEQSKLNPVSFFVKTIAQSFTTYENIDGSMNVEESLSMVRAYLNIVDNHTHTSFSPIERHRQFKEEPVDKNVVLVLMESMASTYLDQEIQGKKNLPYLHELISKTYYFEHFYSAGRHTNNGIMATLYGIPTLFHKSSMEDVTQNYTGLPYYLQQKGYETMFFITGNPLFDNMYPILQNNGFNKIYSSYDYPSDKIANIYGVQDDFLFKFGLDKLNLVAATKKPFFATFLTISNHPPYVVPEQFKNTGKTKVEEILFFADNCLKDFMENAAKQTWFDNTIFLFLGDHGTHDGQHKYDNVPATRHRGQHISVSIQRACH